MRLITGPAGSGKTRFALDNLREAIRRGDRGVRLLVPTATMAQHLRNRLAREGLVFPAAAVQTVSRFIEAYAPPAPQASSAVLNLLVEDAVRQLDRLEFARVAGLPGFSSSLARTIGEFSSAGCASTRLEAHLPDTPLGAAFLAVYREVDAELARRGIAFRAVQLERAAARIAAEGAPGVTAVLLDGFHALPDPELAIIGALAAHVDLVVTLTDGEATRETRGRLLEMGARETTLAARRAAPAVMVAAAPNLEREVEEIARRILEQARAGRPFREIGVVVRSAAIYVPLLRSVLERFGIPARFYFDEPLDEHPAVRFLTGAVEAMLGGWDYQAVLDILRMAPRLANSTAADRFDFKVRECIPGSGLAALKAMLAPAEGQTMPPSHARIVRVLDGLAALEEWQALELDPAGWADRFRTLRNLYRPARPAAGADHEMALLWRREASALDLFDQALDDAAAALAGRPRLGVREFWAAARAALRLTPLRLADDRRNVVHVLSAHEARQWELPVVFVCGMVERQFPGVHPQDPFFPEAARVRLRRSGIRIRTAHDFEIEERGLFDSAMSRATMLCVLSYPEFDARGERNLPSIYLEDLAAPRVESQPIRPRPRSEPAPRPAPAIRDPRLLEALRPRTAVFAPTPLEMYLQCPYQYFGAKTLGLKSPPALPADRLDFMLQGNIVHAALKEWWEHPQAVAPLFERIFEEHCDRENVPSGYRRQRMHDLMLANVLAFTGDGRWPRDRFRSRVEAEFQFALGDGLDIRGTIDRLDTDEGGRGWVIDYKYSNSQATKGKLENDDLLQAPLYLMAAARHFGLEPAGMYYIGLRGDVQYAGWAADPDSAPVAAEPLPDNWTEVARSRTIQAVDEIRSGRILPSPSDPGRCARCDFLDVCRIETEAGRAAAEGV